MTFRVEWLQAALDELAAIWLQQDRPGREALTQAIHLAEQQLQRAPMEVGESRPGGQRILFMLPLGVLYRVVVQSGDVTVLHVWRIRAPGAS